MTENNITHQIHEAILANQLTQAQTLMDEAWKNADHTAELHYLQGRIFMKRSLWSKAISSFLHAEELDPESPAKECRLMLKDIMDFYNKDMYNQ